LRRVFDAMRSQIVSGAPVKLELLELLAIEGVALRSIASGPQSLFCSDVGAGSPAWGMTAPVHPPAGAVSFPNEKPGFWPGDSQTFRT
jgi:hypothetical protein